VKTRDQLSSLGPTLAAFLYFEAGGQLSLTWPRPEFERLERAPLLVRHDAAEKADGDAGFRERHANARY